MKPIDSLTSSGHGQIRLSLQIFANITAAMTYDAVVTVDNFVVNVGLAVFINEIAVISVGFADFINDNSIVRFDNGKFKMAK